MIKGISVVIATYNREGDCRRAVNSILDQSSPLDLQIIIVDDGSKEEYDVGWFTERGCSYMKIDNSGVCAARNIGFGLATNVWVALLDDDDWWKPNHLELLSEVIQSAKEDVVMVYSQVTDFFADGSEMNRQFKQRLPGQSDLDYIFDNGRMPSATCYRRSAVVQVPFEGTDFFSEDIWHSGRLLSTGKSIPVFECTVMYNQTSMRTTRGWNKRTYLAAIATYSKMRSDPDFQSVRVSLFDEKLAYWYYFGIRHVSMELNFRQWVSAVTGLLRYNSVSMRQPVKSLRRAASNVQLILTAFGKRLLSN